MEDLDFEDDMNPQHLLNEKLLQLRLIWKDDYFERVESHVNGLNLSALVPNRKWEKLFLCGLKYHSSALGGIRS